jgi:hypothetical protein
MIASQLGFAVVLFSISGICLSAPRIVQRFAVTYCPDFVRSYVEADFYRAHVRICGGGSLYLWPY